MDAFALIILCCSGLIGLEWVIRNALALPVWKRVFHLRGDYAPPRPGREPKISVVVPAKDEAANIALSLESLLGQDYPEFEIVVVDDRSEDATADIVREFMEKDSRVRLIQVAALPDGWCGKNHAMHLGVAEAEADWILMTDADCRFISPQTLRAAVAYAQDTDAQLLSLLPTLEANSFWERLLIPICAGILMIWFNPKKVSNLKRSAAFANGQFMLMRRETYDAIGGHKAIKDCFMEDIEFARRIKANGRPVRFAPTEDLFEVRMYDSRAGIVRGFARIFLGTFRNFLGLLGALLVLLIRGMTPFVCMILSGVMVLAAAEPQNLWSVTLIVSSVGFIAQEIMTARFYAHAGYHWGFGLAYPFGCTYSASILIKAMSLLRPGAKITWRNTTYNATH